MNCYKRKDKRMDIVAYARHRKIYPGCGGTFSSCICHGFRQASHMQRYIIVMYVKLLFVVSFFVLFFALFCVFALLKNRINGSMISRRRCGCRDDPNP
jgi:hypothetical protein